MAAKTKSVARRKGLVPINMKIPAETIAAVDKRRDELNKSGGWPQVTRTDLIRNALAEAFAAWGAKPAAKGGES